MVEEGRDVTLESRRLGGLRVQPDAKRALAAEMPMTGARATVASLFIQGKLRKGSDMKNAMPRNESTDSNDLNELQRTDINPL